MVCSKVLHSTYQSSWVFCIDTQIKTIKYFITSIRSQYTIVVLRVLSQPQYKASQDTQLILQ